MTECSCCGDEYVDQSTGNSMCIQCNGAGCPDPDGDCRRWW